MVGRTLILAALLPLAVGTLSAQQDTERVTFRSAANVVSVAVVARAGDGRLLTNLRKQDFEILDNGRPRSITQFHQGDEADARMALLVDSSGSMVVGAKRERSRLAADFLVAGFAGRDAASVFTFDSRLRRLTGFTRDPAELRAAVASVEPFGTTCLYDAIVHTIGSVAEETPRARALVLVTDGIDTGSVTAPADATKAAAALDIPVYVLGVGDAVAPAADTVASPDSTLTLADLASRSGGAAFEASSPAQLSLATRSMLAELHHQYLVAFEAGSEKGWHRLTVRVRHGRVQARSRDGYVVP